MQKKIQQLIDEHIRSLHISELINPMEITYENFLAFVKGKVKSKRAQTALIKNKAIQVIEELKSNNPAYYEKLYLRLLKIIEDEKQRRKQNAEYFVNPELYEEIYKKALAEEEERKKVFGDYEATPFEFSLYSELNEIKNDRNQSIELTKKIYAQFKDEIEIVGWKSKTSVEKNMKSIIYDTLSSENFPDEKLSEFSEKIITLVKNRL